MGCDIHMVLEQKIGEGSWIGIHHFPYYRSSGGTHHFPDAIGRNYRRFAAMAGVRGDGPEPRGLPEDVSVLSQARSDHYGSDGHSHSWLPVREAAAIFLASEYGEPDDYAKKYPTAHFFGVEPEDADDYRIVFWFDN